MQSILITPFIKDTQNNNTEMRQCPASQGSPRANLNRSLYFSKTAYEAANQPKELLIVKDATHVDLYDRMDKIPFDNITAFFNKNLNK